MRDLVRAPRARALGHARTVGVLDTLRSTDASTATEPCERCVVAMAVCRGFCYPCYQIVRVEDPPSW